jgi:hypothetical protein
MRLWVHVVTTTTRTSKMRIITAFALLLLGAYLALSGAFTELLMLIIGIAGGAILESSKTVYRRL